jgi:hypothetical protein
MPRPRIFLVALALSLSGAGALRADDGAGLQRGANGNDVSLSGVSSGAAMAVQYAVAHSASVVGVGAIAGPGWGCADGRVTEAVNDCMCGRQTPLAKVDMARTLAAAGSIDALVDGKPQALQRSFVFHSAADATVVSTSGLAGIDFLAAFVGSPPIVDRGNATDGSDAAGHGIVAPGGSDACRADGNETTYVRRCAAEDNAGKLFLALYGNGAAYDASQRVNDIAPGDIWQFDQQRLIDEVKQRGGTIASDQLLFWLIPTKSARRANFDLASTGYLYVPPSCRQANSGCRVHVALHGCKQEARSFAATAGYNNWAEHYQVIVVYPAVQPDAPLTDDLCRLPAVNPIVNNAWHEPNPNGCWDWWGYLDTGVPANRYLTKAGPQLQVIERIIAELTQPVH